MGKFRGSLPLTTVSAGFIGTKELFYGGRLLIFDLIDEDADGDYSCISYRLEIANHPPNIFLLFKSAEITAKVLLCPYF